MEKCESNAFEAGGYKWKLVFYPNGNNTSTSSTTSSTQNGLSTGNHVSMYLKIVETNSLPRGWTVDVSFRFFVLDQTSGKYLILGDMGGKTRRFHEMKAMWGYSQLLPLKSLNDCSNGYLVDNSCVFGAEVFPCKNTGCGDCLTIMESPSCFKYTWKIENFSQIKEVSIYSDVFVSRGYSWKIMLLPKGDSRTNNKIVSMYLCLNGSTKALESAGGEQVFARYKLRVRDQVHDFHKEGDEDEDKKWFIAPGGWGCLTIIRLDELNDKSKGYLVNDTCIAEAEVTVLGVLKKLS